MTLNGVMALFFVISLNASHLKVNYVKLVAARPTSLQQKCSPEMAELLVQLLRRELNFHCGAF